MYRFAAELYNWLKQANINPDDVTVVLRAKHERVAHDLEVNVTLDSLFVDVGSITRTASNRKFKLHGLSFVISNLDASR